MDNTTDYSEIISNLYIGDNKATQLLSDSLNLVVNCTKELPVIFPNTIRIPIDEFPDYNNELIKLLINTNVLDIIHSNLLKNEKVLVHCMEGDQRSCAVVACYLIKYHSLTVEKAIQLIRTKKQIAFSGNIYFIDAINYYYYS